MQTLNSFPSLNWCLWFRWMLTFIIQIVQHLVVVVSCPVHLGPVILLGCLRELNDLQMWLTFYKKFNGTKTFPSLIWCLWLKWMETFFILIVQYLVVLRMAWKLSEIIPLLTQKLYCTSTMWHLLVYVLKNRTSKNEKVMSLIRCLVKIYLQFYIQIRNNYPC